MGAASMAQGVKAVAQRRDAGTSRDAAQSQLPGDPRLQALQRRADAAPRVGRTLALGDSLNGATTPVVQRNIGATNPAPTPFFRATNLQNQPIRAPWVGHWANALVPGGQSRNHVIPYHHIAEALTNILNLIYTQRAATPLAVPAAVAQLTALANSLFPNNMVAGYAPMVLNQTAAVNAIYAAVAAPALTPILTGNMTTAATALESDLTSAQDNVRTGDANMNLRLGNNIDADFAPGLTTLPAYAVPTPVFLPGGLVVPTAWTAAMGANWGTTQNGLALGVGGQFYCMTAAHNNLTWNFGAAAVAHIQTNLTVVRNDDPNNMVPGYTGHAPLSSTGNPAAGLMAGAGSPVMLFDPAGVVAPYRFA